MGFLNMKYFYIKYLKSPFRRKTKNAQPRAKERVNIDLGVPMEPHTSISIVSRQRPGLVQKPLGNACGLLILHHSSRKT